MPNKIQNALNYRISGNGSPVLFLHGFMEDSSMWNHILPLDGIQAICIDLEGHGSSPINQETAPTINEMAEQVWKLVQEHQWQQAQIVGHSMGGYVGLELLYKNTSFEHLTLLHSHPWEDAPEKKKDRNRVIELVKTKANTFIKEAIPNLFAFPEKNKTAIETYIKTAARMSPEAIARASAAMRDRENREQLIVETPRKFTFIQGTHDRLIPRADTSNFCNSHRINYIEIAGCGHMSQEETPEILREILATIFGTNTDNV